MPELAGTLFAKVFASSVAHAHIQLIDFTAAEQMEGVHRIISHDDIPGENQIGGIIADEELLASTEVHFIGMPILIIIAETDIIAHKACELVNIEYKEKEIITDPVLAYEKGQFLSSPLHFESGNTTKAFETCAHIFLSLIHI